MSEAGSPPARADWKRIAGRAAEPAGAAVSPGARRAAPAPPVAMGLQFELREQTPRTNDRWRGATARTVTSLGAGHGVLRLGVRPVILNARGNWVRTNVSWNQLGFHLNRLNLNLAHHRWLSQLLALHRAVRGVYTSQEADWLYLDDFASPLLWTLFDEADVLGLRLVGSKKDATVTVHREARVSLDATAHIDYELLDAIALETTAHPAVPDTIDVAPATTPATVPAPAGLRLTTRLLFDGAPHDPARAGAIGTHGVYGFALGPQPAFTLAPTAGPLSPEQARLLGRPDSVIVPESDVTEFLTEFYPALRHALPVTSTDATVHFPESDPPVLVLTARFRPRQTLDLGWHWEYHEGSAVTALPVLPVLPSLPLLPVRAVRAEAGSPAGRPADSPADSRGAGSGPGRRLEHAPRAVTTATTNAPGDDGTADGTNDGTDDGTDGDGTDGDGTDGGTDHNGTGDDGSRDTAAERDILGRVNAELEQAGQGRLGPAAASVTLQGVDAAEFTEKTLGRLALPGVRVDAVGVQPDYRELTETPELTITTIETDQRDWFDLGVIVTIDGRSVPFGPLFKALAKGRNKLLLVDNSYLSLRQPAFERLHELIDEARALQEWDTGLRISRYQAGLWAEFEDLAEHTEQAVAWRAAVSGLLALNGPNGDTGTGAAASTDTSPAPVLAPTALPAGVRATLRPYQMQGFTWLAFLWRHRLGGILADDMGLGKTLQTLALIVHATGEPGPVEPGTDRRPFLVVAPTSVVANWASEAARFTPGLTVRVITATEAASGVTLTDAAAGADVLVTSYTLFRLDFEAYQAHGWAGLILDEAQFVKNRTSRLHQCARELNTPFKLAITGTPLENNLLELHALFAIVAPGLFPSLRRFTEEYVRPVERGDNPERLARLRRRIRPLLLRRTKELVAPELPPKQEQVLQIPLNARHRTLYDTFLQRERQKLFGLIDDLDQNRFIVFRSLTLLRLLSLDPSLVDEKYAGVPSSKLDALFEQLEDVVAEGHRALVFSQFTSFLQKAAARLDARGTSYCYLDGSTLRRSEVIDRFKTGAEPVFLISLKAGGFGLNLTEADYVFLLDPWWNPATETQAVDRTHRIGQTRNVMVYRMVATGTIEEKVMALQQRKAALFDSVLGGEGTGFSDALTADDIRGLLER
ncbi:MULTISPECIES: DEAD/DEAH box helicase [unclassified Cryobacterium]|uniref:DEAD/DEAH box helicase n=1 Tax=unclassified Cryobacterium TaxID=2649013 RepID=UPI00187E894B|nr:MULTISPECIES: DEAD/DEAH box helicase [unclassified Cryobacterium]